jgi:TolB-like protein/DNA-binding winged helix-turn-helix (wHTH) protein
MVELERGFRVGHWDVYPLRNVINRSDNTLHLEAKAIQVLVALARRPGEVVSRRELLQEVWQDRPVSDEVLSRCVSLLRSSLGDEPRDPHYIQTIPRVGYRLIAPVSLLAEHGGEAPQGVVELPPAAGAVVKHRDPTSRRARLLVASLAAALVGAALYVTWDRQSALLPSKSQPIQIDAIAVQPFRDLSADPGDAYFADVITDELITRLSGLPGLKVNARAKALAFKNPDLDTRVIGRKLGVAHLVTGTVKISANRLRVTAQLIETRGGMVIWSHAYDATVADAFSVQHSISVAIVEALLPTLQEYGRVTNGLRIAAEPDAKAYLLFLRARHLLKSREEESLWRAVGLLDEAIEIDPRYAPAYVALAKVQLLLQSYSNEPVDVAFARAERVIEMGRARGVPIGDAAEGVAAFIALTRRDWLVAERGLAKALAADPNDPDLHHWYAVFHASVGRVDLSLQHALQASELDPVSPVINHRLAMAYLWADEDELALQRFEDAGLLGFRETVQRRAYIISLLRAGQDAKVARLLTSMQAMQGAPAEWIEPMLAALGDAALLGLAVHAVEAAAAVGGIEPRLLFGVWVYLGEHDRAIDLAVQAAAARRVIDVEFLFAREAGELRRHPRFGELLTLVGLDRYWDAVGWPSWCDRESVSCLDPPVSPSGPSPESVPIQPWPRVSKLQ